MKVRVLVEFEFNNVDDVNELLEAEFDRYDLRRMEEETGARRVTLLECFGEENP